MVECLICLGSKAFLDKNSNGVYDEGEDEPLEGVHVTIIPVEDKYGNINYINTLKEELGTIDTDENGDYEFCNLIPGAYKLQYKADPDSDGTPYYTTTGGDESGANSFVEGVGETGIINLDSGSNAPILLAQGFVQELCIGDKVWYDKNLNGIQDEDAGYGVVDIPVKLFMQDDNGKWVAIAATKTDKKGEYKFCNLTPGKSYKEVFTLPEGYKATLQNKGDDFKDSDGNKEAEIIITNLHKVDDDVYNGVKDNKAGDYTQDLGIYCNCNDFKAHPEEYKEVKAPALNIAGAALLLLTLWMASFARREQN